MKEIKKVEFRGNTVVIDGVKFNVFTESKSYFDFESETTGVAPCVLASYEAIVWWDTPCRKARLFLKWHTHCVPDYDWYFENEEEYAARLRKEAIAHREYRREKAVFDEQQSALRTVCGSIMGDIKRGDWAGAVEDLARQFELNSPLKCDPRGVSVAAPAGDPEPVSRKEERAGERGAKRHRYPMVAELDRLYAEAQAANA